jgi:hypothetical protein
MPSQPRLDQERTAARKKRPGNVSSEARFFEVRRSVLAKLLFPLRLHPRRLEGARTILARPQELFAGAGSSDAGRRNTA